MPGDAERLRRYWSTGRGAALIGWGTTGDWTRCVEMLSEHMPGRAQGYCALLHKRNTGLYTGDKAHRGLSHTAPGGPSPLALAHDLLFYTRRSTPKVVDADAAAPDVPDGYGRLIRRRRATPDEERDIGAGRWIRVDHAGRHPGDPGYRRTAYRPALVRASHLQPAHLMEDAVNPGTDQLALTTPKVTPEQDKIRWDAYRKRVAENKAKKAIEDQKAAEKDTPTASGSEYKPTRAPAGTPTGGQFAAGPPRNDAAKKAQENPEARKNYEAMQGLDPAATNAMLDGLNDKDLQDVSRAAYSFKSKDPKVVAQRIAVANALARRGQDVNDHGGLGKKGATGPAAGKPNAAPSTSAVTKPAAPSKPATPAARRAPQRPALRPTTRPTAGRTPTRAKPQPGQRVAGRGTQTALSNTEIDRLELSGPNVAARKQMADAGQAMPDGSFPVRSLDDLRKAVMAFGRAAPDKQAAVKAHLIKRARLMGGENMIPADWR